MTFSRVDVIVIGGCAIATPFEEKDCLRQADPSPPSKVVESAAAACPRVLETRYHSGLTLTRLSPVIPGVGRRFIEELGKSTGGLLTRRKSSYTRHRPEIARRTSLSRELQAAWSCCRSVTERRA
jgi:hypothetical protein